MNAAEIRCVIPTVATTIVTVVLATLFLQSIRLPFLALLLAAFVCFTFRLRDENINGPEEPASELVRDFFPTGFK